MKEKCNNCAHPSKSCISFLMTLSTKEMLEWCRIWKERLGWSNATLAEKSHVPKGTIDRVLSYAKGDDITEVKLSTIRPIICALTGCSIEELEACSSGAEDNRVAALLKKNKRLEDYVVQMNHDAESQQAFFTHQVKIKDRYIAILASLLGVAVLVIIGLLVIDALLPNIGFLWMQ